MLTMQSSTSHGNVAAVDNVMAQNGIPFASIVGSGDLDIEHALQGCGIWDGGVNSKTSQCSRAKAAT